MPGSCARSAPSCPQLFSRPGEMSCRFACELTVLLLVGREVTLYIQSCIIKERNLFCFPFLLSVTHTHTLGSSVPDKSFFPFPNLSSAHRIYLHAQGISHWAEQNIRVHGGSGIFPLEVWKLL